MTTSKPIGRANQHKGETKMGLLAKVRGIREEYEIQHEKTVEGERKDLFEIAVRDFLDTPKDGDADKLYNALEILEMKDDDYQQIVQGVGRVVNAAASAEFTAEQWEGHTERFEQARREMLTAQGELKRAQRRVNELQQFAGTRMTVSQAYREVKEKFPQLFDENGVPHKSLQKLIVAKKKELAETKANAIKAADAMIDAEVESFMRRQGLLNTDKE